MTGSDVQRIRNQFELTIAQFADLIGVSPSSVYRWEAACLNLAPVEPFQLRLFALMRTASRKTKISVRDGLVIGGGLLGLYRLLDGCLPRHLTNTST